MLTVCFLQRFFLCVGIVGELCTVYLASCAAPSHTHTRICCVLDWCSLPGTCLEVTSSTTRCARCRCLQIGDSRCDSNLAIYVPITHAVAHSHSWSEHVCKCPSLLFLLVPCRQLVLLCHPSPVPLLLQRPKPRARTKSLLLSLLLLLRNSRVE